MKVNRSEKFDIEVLMKLWLELQEELAAIRSIRGKGSKRMIMAKVDEHIRRRDCLGFRLKKYEKVYKKKSGKSLLGMLAKCLRSAERLELGINLGTLPDFSSKSVLEIKRRNFQGIFWNNLKLVRGLIVFYYSQEVLLKLQWK